MNTMPLPEIIRRLTALNNNGEQLAQTFITEFSALVAKALSESGSVNVKGLGTFRRIELGSDVTVEFAPDSTLAEAVNSPFAMFEPVELDDEVTAEMLDKAAQKPESEPTLPQGMPPVPPKAGSVAMPHSPISIPEIPESEPESEPEPTQTPEAEPARTHAPHAGNAPEQPATAHPESQHANAPLCNEHENNRITHEKIIEKERVVEVVGRSHHHIHLVITALVALAAGVIIGCFTADLLNLSNVKSVNISADDVQVYHQQPPAENNATATDAEPADTVSAQEQNPAALTAADTVSQPAASVRPAETEAKAIVTDTVRSNRFLTTMAREYYGKKKFWVYIYEENRNRLSNPDRIEANTVVVIPPAEKYGIKAGDKASEEDAERRASEIMSNR